jgi:SAM-dependent MidA family methyltransferase
VLHSASDEIRAAIADAGGAIPFETFMDLALYGADGFYAGTGSAGRRGDFITSPEIGPLFGAVLARALDAWWAELGEPDPFTFVDAGAGPGTLARAIDVAGPRCREALRYVAVEVSTAQRGRHPDWVVSTETMPHEPITGVVFANELLDNLPFRLFVMDGGWREAYVVAQNDGFAEVLEAPRLATPLLPDTASHGARVPVQQRASQWLVAATRRVVRGRVVVVDYAAATTASFADRPWREWLRTYRGHERGEHYLRGPGTQDITTEVAIDQLLAAAGEPDAICTQAQFLQRWGIADLVDEGRRVWTANSDRPDLAALAMRSRIREAEALLQVPGLGAFTVLEFGHPADRR